MLVGKNTWSPKAIEQAVVFGAFSFVGGYLARRLFEKINRGKEGNGTI